MSELITRPVRDELKKLGFEELRTPADVDEVLGESAGTVLVAVNSMCGCAAARMRPAVAQAVKHEKRPDRLTTVFAGQDMEATERAREYFTGYPPSSPSVALLRDGKVIYMLERRDIERRRPEDIAQTLKEAFERLC
ncbi:MAG: BrxA/BrxB family bacilliredoxin [Gemmatimonadota bacterium]